MIKNKWEKSPQELVDLFYNVMEKFPEAELRKMFGYPCAFINGNMCIGLHESNMAIRLPADVRQKALDEGEGTIFAPMKGRVMREYVSISEEIRADKKKLTSYLKKSVNYAKTLPPKVKKAYSKGKV